MLDKIGLLLWLLPHYVYKAGIAPTCTLDISQSTLTVLYLYKSTTVRCYPLNRIKPAYPNYSLLSQLGMKYAVCAQSNPLEDQCFGVKMNIPTV